MSFSHIILLLHALLEHELAYIYTYVIWKMINIHLIFSILSTSVYAYMLFPFNLFNSMTMCKMLKMMFVRITFLLISMHIEFLIMFFNTSDIVC